MEDLEVQEKKVSMVERKASIAPLNVKDRHPEYQYLDLLREIKDHGEDKPSASSGERLRYVLGRTHHYDLSEGFPLLTTKDVFWKGVKHELLWFLKGDTNIKYLVDNGVHIWDGDAYKKYKKSIEADKAPNLSKDDYIQRITEDEEFAMQWGELGPVYGSQWRKWKTPDGREVDQIDWIMDKLTHEPYRKHLVFTAWNPSYIYEMAPSEEEEMALPPCHMISQIDVSESGELSLMMTQRSCDTFLGVPFNIASYSLLTEMFAHVAGLKPGWFIHTLNNVHIYHKHFAAVDEQLAREPYQFPKLVLDPNIGDIDKFTYDGIKVVGYKHHPAIKAELITVGGRIKKDANA